MNLLPTLRLGRVPTGENVLFHDLSFVGNCFKNKCLPGGILKKGDPLISENGEYKVILQENGNLQVLYGTMVVWSSNTINSNVEKLHFEKGGDLVISGTSQQVYWSTNTGSKSPKAEILVKSDDGDLQLLSKDNQRVWHSGPRLVSPKGRISNTNKSLKLAS